MRRRHFAPCPRCWHVLQGGPGQGWSLGRVSKLTVRTKQLGAGVESTYQRIIQLLGHEVCGQLHDLDNVACCRWCISDAVAS